MEKKEEKIFRDIVKILEQDVPQEALAEGNPTPEQEAIALIKQELDKAREEGRREYAHELLDDYYDPDRDSVEIDIDVLQKEFDLISNSEITSKQRQTEEILEEGYRIMAEDEARMKDEIALETYKQATTEKQEEWKEKLLQEKWVEDLLRMAVIAYIHEKEEVVIDLPSLISFISQLLSERTFTREELGYIQRLLYGSNEAQWIESLRKKVSKLLRRKSEERRSKGNRRTIRKN